MNTMRENGREKRVSQTKKMNNVREKSKMAAKTNENDMKVIAKQ